MGEALSKAQALEKGYQWLEARDLYEQVLGAVDEKDLSKKAELQEGIAHCLHGAAFQAESREEFKERMGKAIEAYEEARARERASKSTLIEEIMTWSHAPPWVAMPFVAVASEHGARLLANTETSTNARMTSGLEFAAMTKQ